MKVTVRGQADRVFATVVIGALILLSSLSAVLSGLNQYDPDTTWKKVE